MTNNFHKICPNGIIQQGDKTINELFLNINTITQIAKIGRYFENNFGEKIIPVLRINLNSNEYYFVKYKDIDSLEKDYNELIKLTKNGNAKLE